jgi:hypothetical protein
MSDATARAVATVGIWAGAAVILAFGAFRTTWGGDYGVVFLLLTVVMVLTAAGVCTGVVWGWKPPKPPPGARPEDRQPGDT